jgi:hypothetical protein
MYACSDGSDRRGSRSGTFPTGVLHSALGPVQTPGGRQGRGRVVEESPTGSRGWLGDLMGVGYGTIWPPAVLCQRMGGRRLW